MPKLDPCAILAALLKTERIPFQREVQGIPGRRYRFDFTFSGMKYVEVDGGIWIKGGHSTGIGISQDRDKDLAAFLAGWRGLRFTSDHIRKKPDFVITCIKKLLTAPS